MADPFLVPEPCLLHISGGRTSAYMLWRILRAYSGRLPKRVVPVFCNTGKEREETLVFLEECAARWHCPIVWLEFRWEPGRHYFERVHYCNASRKGEPFLMSIQSRSALPNQAQRICTIDLKIRTANRYARQVLGFVTFFSAIGFRADEEKRVTKMKAEAHYPKLVNHLFGEDHSGEMPIFPAFEGGVSKAEVNAFWQEQRGGLALEEWLTLPESERPGWDLALREGEGNCDLCFLKGAGTIVELMRRWPNAADWWIEVEASRRKATGEPATFHKSRPPYSELLQIATDKLVMPGWMQAERGPTGACGEMIECRCTD